MTITEQALRQRQSAGRPRIPNRRPEADRDHQAVEPVHVIQATVIAQRTRVVGADNAGHYLAGFCLGRLLLNHKASRGDPMSIDESQFGAGERYAKLAAMHASIMGYQTGSPRSAILDMIGGGISCKKEPDQELILEVRRQWGDTYRVLMDAGEALRRGPYVAIATYDICLERRSYDALDKERVGDLRLGLNALRRLYAMQKSC